MGLFGDSNSIQIGSSCCVYPAFTIDHVFCSLGEGRMKVAVIYKNQLTSQKDLYMIKTKRFVFEDAPMRIYPSE